MTSLGLGNKHLMDINDITILNDIVVCLDFKGLFSLVPEMS